MIIGIGIIAYNRPDNCYKCVQSLYNTLNKNFKYKIVCSVDTDENDLIEKFRKINNDFNVEIVYHKNCGVSINKSIALYHLRECDHFFLIEEDVEFIKSNWVDLFLTAHNLTQYGLLNTIEIYPQEELKKYYVKTIHFNDFSISFYKRHSAQIMSITKKTFNIVGYLNPKFKCYGFEHCEYTYRCGLVNLCPIGIYPIIENLFEFIKYQDCQKSIDTNNVEIKNILKFNCNLYNTTVLMRGPIYISFENIKNYLPNFYYIK